MAANSVISSSALRSSIKGILSSANLDELTSKRVRKQLEEIHKIELIERKDEIDRLLMELIEEQEENNASSSDDEKPAKAQPKKENNHVKKNVNSQTKDNKRGSLPSKSKKKSPLSKEEIVDSSDSEGCDTAVSNDAEVAKRLHESESGLRKRRSTTRKPQGPAVKKERKSGKKTGFTKEMILSPELSSLLGQDRMCRSDVVKRMWEIIKERNLGDPKNKRFTLCDNQLESIFGRKRFLTFGMMKYLKNHVRDPELIVQ